MEAWYILILRGVQQGPTNSYRHSPHHGSGNPRLLNFAFAALTIPRTDMCHLYPSSSRPAGNLGELEGYVCVNWQFRSP